MKKVFLGFGSNVGDRRKNIEKALAFLQEKNGLHFVRASHLYETEPVGMKEQPYFFNMVAEFETELSSSDILRCAKETEEHVGRISRQRWGPREIDVDVLFYGDECVETEHLVLPHPEVAKRKFVLIPLSEIAPHFRDPRSGKLIEELLAECVDSSGVQQVD